eukprot:jgi/Psemu1/319826/estExt_fgenesh1_pm.C_3080005
MRLRRVWDVKMPPPSKYIVNKRMVYTGVGQINLGQRSRKIVIEILGPDREEGVDDDPTILSNENENENENEINASKPKGKSIRSRFSLQSSRFDSLGILWEKEQRASDGTRRDMMVKSRRMGGRQFIDLSSELKDDDLIAIRILKHRRGRWGINRDPEDNDSSDDDYEDGDSDSDSSSSEGTKTSSHKLRSWIRKRRSRKKERNKWLDTAIKEYKANKYVISREEDWVEYRKFGLDEIKAGDKQYRKTWEATIGIGKYREKRKIFFKSQEQAQDFKTEIDKLRKLSKERATFRLRAYRKYQMETQERAEDAFTKSSRSSEFKTDTIQNNGSINIALPTSVPKPSAVLASCKSALGSLPISILTKFSSNTNDTKPDLEKLKSIYLAQDINLLVEIVSCSDLPIADSTSTDPYVVVFLGVNAIHRTDYVPKELNPVWTVHSGSLFMVSCSAEEFFSFTYGLVFCVKDYDVGTKDELVGRAELTQSQLLSMTGERIAVELDVPLEVREHGPNRENFGEDAIYTPKLYLRIRKATLEDKKFIMNMNSIKRAKRQGVYADKTFKANADVMGLFKKDSLFEDGIELCRVKPGPDPNRPPEETRWMTKSKMIEEALKPSQSWVESGNGKLGKIYVEILKCDKLPNLMFHYKVKSEKRSTDPFCCLVFEDAIGYTDVIRNSTEPRWMPWSQRSFVFNVAHASSNLMIGVFDHELTGFHYPIGPARNLPSVNYLNLPNKFEFMTVYYVCHGDEDPGRFSLETLYAYQAELEENFVHVHLIQQAAISVLFWRGHYRIKFFGRSLNLPIHSFVAFVMGVTLIENFNLLPSYALFSIAWVLIATYEARQAHPSPWRGTLTLSDMWSSAIKQKSVPAAISAFENEAAVVRYDEEMKRRFEEEQEILKRRQETAQQLSEFYGAGSTEPEDLSAESETKRVGSIIMDKINAVNPLATSLLPIQQMLGNTASFIRILRSLVSWDESIYAFLILNVSLVLGITFLFIPWDLLTRCSLRILIWCLLGPWMKLIDLFVLPRYFGTDLDKDKLLANYAKEQIDSLGLTKDAILRKKEEVYKERSMKRYMFGEYSVMVPRYKDYRYRDTPLPESSATPVLEVQDIKISKKWPGQRLMGDMIPIWGVGLDQRKQTKRKKK